MKRLCIPACCALILSVGGSACAGEMVVREFPDRFVVEYDGTDDPKLPPLQTPEELAREMTQQARREKTGRIRERIEERMEAGRSRIEENRRALEKQREEREERRRWMPLAPAER